jgi:hypothetical protein
MATGLVLVSRQSAIVDVDDNDAVNDWATPPRPQRLHGLGDDWCQSRTPAQKNVAYPPVKEIPNVTPSVLGNEGCAVFGFATPT